MEQPQKPLECPPQNPKPHTLTDHSDIHKPVIMRELKDKVFANMVSINPSFKAIAPQVKIHIEQRLQQLFPSFDTPTHPPYACMIQRAIVELNEEGGSSEEAISAFLKREYEDLPWGHESFLSHYLRKLSGGNSDIVQANDGRYMLLVRNCDGKDMEEWSKRRLRRRGRRRKYQDRDWTEEQRKVTEQKQETEERSQAEGQPIEVFDEPSESGKQAEVTEQKFVASEQFKKSEECKREMNGEENQIQGQRSELMELNYLNEDRGRQCGDQYRDWTEKQSEFAQEEILSREWPIKRQRELEGRQIEVSEEPNASTKQQVIVTEQKIVASEQPEEGEEQENNVIEVENQMQGQQSALIEKLNEINEDRSRWHRDPDRDWTKDESKFTGEEILPQEEPVEQQIEKEGLQIKVFEEPSVSGKQQVGGTEQEIVASEQPDKGEECEGEMAREENQIQGQQSELIEGLYEVIKEQNKVFEELNEAERPQIEVTELQKEDFCGCYYVSMKCDKKLAVLFDDKMDISDKTILELTKVESNWAEADKNEVTEEQYQIGDHVIGACQEHQPHNQHIEIIEEPIQLLPFKGMCMESVEKTTRFEEQLSGISLHLRGMEVPKYDNPDSVTKEKSNECLMKEQCKPESVIDVKRKECLDEEQCKPESVIDVKRKECLDEEQSKQTKNSCAAKVIEEQKQKAIGEQSQPPEQKTDVKTKTPASCQDGESEGGVNLRFPCGQSSVPVAEEEEWEFRKQEEWPQRSPCGRSELIITCGLLAKQRPQPKKSGQQKKVKSHPDKMLASSELGMDSEQQRELSIIERPPKPKTDVNANTEALSPSDPQHLHELRPHKRKSRGRPPKLKHDADMTVEGLLPSDEHHKNKQQQQPEAQDRKRCRRSDLEADATMGLPSCSDQQNHNEQRQLQSRGQCRSPKATEPTATTSDALLRTRYQKRQHQLLQQQQPKCRGRGRPPKQKANASNDMLTSQNHQQPKRPRGRPPKWH